MNLLRPRFYIVLLFFTFFYSLFTFNSFAQGVSISETPVVSDTTAILDLVSTTKGMLIPRLTTAQRNAIVSPAASLIIFNTTTNCYECFIGTWQTIFCSTCSTTPATPVAITGSSSVCGSSSGNIYSIASVSGAASYTWSVPAGASVAAGQGSTLVSVTFGSDSGNVSVTANNACGSSAPTILATTVTPLPATPGAITGSTTVCASSSGNVYSIAAVSGATSYTWSVPVGAAITAGQGTTSATITFGSASGNVSVTAGNSCATSTASVLAVTVNTPPATPGAITGLTSICASQTGVVYSIVAVPGATSYTWSVPSGATITAGQGTTSITVNFGVSSGNVSVTASNACGTSAASTLAVTITSSAPATPGAITGLTTVCSGQAGVVYSIAAVPGATSYTWSTPPGGTVTSGQGTTSATITFGSTSGDVSVTASNGCGTSGVRTLAITIITTPPATPGAITGSTSVCGSQSGVVYSISSVSGASSYTWSVPLGSTITAGQGTTSVTVTFGSTSGDVSVTANNACGISTANSLAVTISSLPPATPGSITGSTTPCSGVPGNVYSIAPVSGATSYTWTVPSGSTVTAGQGTTSATVTFGGTSGNVSVTASNGCGTSSASTLAIISTTAPATPGTITGTIGPCSGQIGVVYSIAPVSGASSYSWTVPPGSTITAGQLTTSITVTFGSTSGAVAVTANNACGNSAARSLTVTILSTPPATPGFITGFTSVASAQAGVVYKIGAVSGAASYTWTVPAGASITAGQSTTSITVTWGSTSGNVCVTASNGCGTSAASCKAITVFVTPTGNNQVFSSTSVVQTFTVPGSVTSILVIANGAASASSYWGCSGSAGGNIVGNVTVTPGQVLNIIAGGAGIFGYGSGGGGGFSGVLSGVTHIISAGGAGGCSRDASTSGAGGGGNAGGCNGGAGGTSPTPAAGIGGTACGNAGFNGTATGGGNGGEYTGNGGGGGGGGGFGTAKGLGAINWYNGGDGGFGGGGGGGSSPTGGSNCGSPSYFSAGGGGGGGFSAGDGGRNTSTACDGGGGGGGSNYRDLAITTLIQNLVGGGADPGENGNVVIGW